MKIRTRDMLERLLWTFIVAVLTNFVGVVVIDIEAWKAAVLAGIAAVVQLVVSIGRWRLKVLPDPGQAIADWSTAAGYAQGLEDAKP